MTKITLETEDGEFVHTAEVDDIMPEAVEWNGRLFLLNENRFVIDQKRGDEPLIYTEVIPLELPYAPMEAKPAGPVDPQDDGLGEDQ